MIQPDHAKKYITEEEWATIPEKAQLYLSQRARPGETKTVTVGPRDHRVTVMLRSGWCPCEKCGHEWMFECEESDCQCCKGTCT